ncbi:MAG: hypothetical protein IKX53_06815 [Bacteroidales bacterium]|nr:hypothetical protein [Bacteroidales bacterium]
MNRTISEFVMLAGTFLLLAIWCASGMFVSGTAVPHTFLSGLLAVAVILFNAILLYLAEDKILAQVSLFTPAAYIILATANPEALWFSPFHGASLLLAVSMLFYLGFCAVRPSMGNLTASWAFLGASALLFPPFLWLAPLYAVTAFNKAEDKFKFWVASLLALCLPFGLYLGILALQPGSPAPVTFFANLWDGMTSVTRTSLHFPAATLLRIVLTALATVLAILWSIGRLDRYKIARSAAVLRIIYLTLAFCVLIAVFLPDSRHPAGLVTALPVSLLLNEYICAPDRKKGSRTLAVILILILIAERIACYV